MESKFKVSTDGKWFDQTDLTYKINEYDEYAIEEAVRLKEKLGNVNITVLSIGPERVKEAIRKALAIGADQGVHILDDNAHLKDPFQIASLIANYARIRILRLFLLECNPRIEAQPLLGQLFQSFLGITA